MQLFISDDFWFDNDPPVPHHSAPLCFDFRPMSQTRLIPAASCQRSARLFNLLSIATTLVSAGLYSLGHMIADKKLSFLPVAMSLPPVMIWLAASMFVYAAIAHHPDLTVRHYNKWAGYRYYGLVGFLTIFANDLAHLPTGWGGVWTLFVLALLPWSAYDIWKAGKEPWRDIEVEIQQ